MGVYIRAQMMISLYSVLFQADVMTEVKAYLHAESGPKRASARSFFFNIGLVHEPVVSCLLFMISRKLNIVKQSVMIKKCNTCFFSNKFCQYPLNGGIHEDRAHAKQSLLH